MAAKADIQRQATAHWSGSVRDGFGKASTGGGGLQDIPFSFSSRFEKGKGTNPEELIAAAHASCFSMMLAKLLGDAKRVPRDITTKATLTMASRDGGWKITAIHLDTEVSGDGLDLEMLKKIGGQAKDFCPISVLLRTGLEAITLEVKLKGFSLK